MTSPPGDTIGPVQGAFALVALAGAAGVLLTAALARAALRRLLRR